jgi:hypothetical protein
MIIMRQRPESSIKEKQNPLFNPVRILFLSFRSWFHPELPHEAQHVEHTPELCDLSVGKSPDADYRLLNLLARLGYAAVISPFCPPPMMATSQLISSGGLGMVGSSYFHVVFQG